MILAGRSSPERSVAAAQRQSRATLGGERGCTAAIHPGAPVLPRGPDRTPRSKYIDSAGGKLLMSAKYPLL